MWRVGLALVLAGSVARANGRDDATIGIEFQLGSPQHIVAGMTFGFLRSDDGGATWWWMCEKAIGYGGEFDPVYAFSSSGAVFATTFEGLKVMRDGCSFVATPPGTTNVSTDELGSDGTLFYAAADPADGKIYRSNDDGATFPIAAAPGRSDDWWESLKIAPTDPLRVYLTGYRFEKFCTAQSPTPGIPCLVKADCGPDGSAAPNYCESVKEFLLFRSDDGGVSYAPMSQAAITTTSATIIDIAGIDPSNKDIVYIKASFDQGATGDGLYKSSDGGATWTKILHTGDKYGLSAIVRSSGELVAATKLSGTQRSPGGASCVDEASCSWTPVAGAPHINCLVEHPATHDLWACTENKGTMDTPADGFGMMRTADLVTWTGVMRFQDIAGFVKCDDSTLQMQECVAPFDAKPSVWCCIRDQLGITAGADLCTGLYACMPAPGSEAPPPPHTPAGCCEGTRPATGTSVATIVLGLGTAALLLRRRRA